LFPVYLKEYITNCSKEKHSHLNLKATVIRKETQQIKIGVSQGDATVRVYRNVWSQRSSGRRAVVVCKA